jgi:hypothetical protein
MNRKGLQELLAWVSHRGKFKVAEAGAGRGLGLFAAQNYPKLNSELFFVNSSGIISDVECIGMTVPQFERFQDKVEKGTSNLLIKGTNNYKVVISTTLILAQLFVGAVDPKQRHHTFANYAANVPLHDLPVYYPKHLVELLTLTTLKPKLFGYFALLDKVFETIINPQFPAIDKKVFVQLFNYVRSRAMNLKPNDEDPTFEPFVICPLIELINHSFDPNCWIDARFDRIEEDSLYLIRNRKAIKEGEELTISYGRWGSCVLITVQIIRNCSFAMVSSM